MSENSPEKLRNIGPVSSQWLAEVGVATVADLQSIGVVETYAMVRSRHPQASLNLLWGLAGAAQGIDWRELSQREKQLLKQQLEELTD